MITHHITRKTIECSDHLAPAHAALEVCRPVKRTMLPNLSCHKLQNGWSLGEVQEIERARERERERERWMDDGRGHHDVCGAFFAAGVCQCERATMYQVALCPNSPRGQGWPAWGLHLTIAMTILLPNCNA